MVTDTASFTILGSVEVTLRKQSISELIAAGYYDSVNPDIARIFHRQRPPDVVRVDYGSPVGLPVVTIDGVEELLVRAGLLPATMDLMLAVGAQHRGLPFEHNIVFPGAACVGLNGIRRIGWLGSSPSRERLCGLEDDFGNFPWNTEHAFAGHVFAGLRVFTP